MGTNNKRMHGAWMILVACCMMQGAGLGLISNCAGVFFTPVCNDLGFEMGKFTLYRTLFTVCQALIMPFVARLIREKDVRVVTSIATVVMGGCAILFSTFTELWQFYLFGMIQGCAASFIAVIPAPILLGNWFYKSTGTAVGISAAFSGLMGMIGSSSLGFLIPALGWRGSYVVLGIVSMVVVLPFTVFVLRYKPEDKGMLPYGADETYRRVEKTAAASAKKESFFGLLKQPVFVIALTAHACSIISSYFNTYLTSFGLEAGLTMAVAATLTTMSLCGNMTTKLFLGKLCDSYGVIKVFVGSIAVALFGHALVYTGNPVGMMAGALCYGITMPLSTVLMPLLCRTIWSGERYSTAYSYVTMVGMLLSAPFNTVLGTLYDRTGSYDMTIFVSALSVVIVLVMIVLVSTLTKRERARA